MLKVHINLLAKLRNWHIEDNVHHMKQQLHCSILKEALKKKTKNKKEREGQLFLIS